MMFKKKELSTESDNENKIIEETEGHKNENDTDTEKVVREWQRDAEQLKILVPDFDLAAAIKNKAFAAALSDGATVFEAYKAISLSPKQEQREEVFQNARSARRGTGGATLNPAKMSSDDFKKYIDNIKNA